MKVGSKSLLLTCSNNIQAAGLENVVEIRTGSFHNFALPQGPGTLVCNPPYGERLQPDDPSLSDSWQSLGNFLHGQGDGAQAHVLCGAPELTRHLGLRASRKFPVRNGPIECRWLRYELGRSR